MVSVSDAQRILGTTSLDEFEFKVDGRVTAYIPDGNSANFGHKWYDLNQLLDLKAKPKRVRPELSVDVNDL